MPLDARRVKVLFLAALDLPDAASRSALLDRECGDDLGLRLRLAELLAAMEPTGPPAEGMMAAIGPDFDPTSTGVGDTPVSDEWETINLSGDSPPTSPGSPTGRAVAGRYLIRQEIGEGGMGSVYLADQIHPVRRQVALKLIKAGMDSRSVLSRFEGERQALALMDHPNIAKVLDAGTTETGSPFFVMELVKGMPLTQYCDLHRLGLPQRLELFRQICSAVQHAHQKGIIHRDLKPTNILVETHDGKPVPKVIDFGLAKAIGGLQLTEDSVRSAFGNVAGTPLYMAPEQASFNALDVDTRADVYALGVILYELLTGSTPITRDTFRRAALDEMLRVIREVEPPAPSSRISNSDALPSLAATRQVEPSRLGRFVRGELDWIVMKALAKERQRRYESPIAFAEDIGRFLNHEPVSAGPPSASYRLRKFARRHRLQVTAAALVMLALVVGVVGTTIGLFEARRQRGFAVAEAELKEKARDAEARQRSRAEDRLGRLRKAVDIMGSIFRDLNPKEVERQGRTLTEVLGEHLDQATAQIEGEAIGDALTVARMQEVLGDSQRGLGNPRKAVVLFEKARGTLAGLLGPDDPETLEAMSDLGLVYGDLGKLDQSIALLEQTLAKREAKLGREARDTISSRSNLGTGYLAAGKIDRALPLLEEARNLAKSKLGADDPLTLTAMNNLAITYKDAGKFDRALPLYEETLAIRRDRLGPNHIETLDVLGNLGLCYQEAGDLKRAVPMLEEALRISKAKLGAEHNDTLTRINNLAAAFVKRGEPDRATPLLEETLRIKKAKLGADHPDTLALMNNLAENHRVAARYDQAIALIEEALPIARVKLGPDHPGILVLTNNLATCCLNSGKTERAISLFKQLLIMSRSKLGADHPRTLMSASNLAGAYVSAGQYDKAIALYEETLGKMSLKLGVDHAFTIMLRGNLAAAYHTAGKLDLAIPELERAAAMTNAKFGPDHIETVALLIELASALLEDGKAERAIPPAREATSARMRTAGTDSTKYAEALDVLGLALIRGEKWDEAETPLREALKIREAKEPGSWRISPTRSALGAALLGRKQYADAEPLLRDAHEGLKQPTDRVPPRIKKLRLAESLDRLIELAEATGKPEEASAWKAERAKLAEAKAPEPKSP